MYNFCLTFLLTNKSIFLYNLRMEHLWCIERKRVLSEITLKIKNFSILKKLHISNEVNTCSSYQNWSFDCFAGIPVNENCNEIPTYWECPNGCRRQYNNRGNLIRHLRYECGVPKMFKCHICGTAYARRNQCKAHVLRKHRILISDSYFSC